MTQSGTGLRAGSDLPLIFVDVDGTLLPFGATSDYPVFSGMDRRHGRRLLETRR